MEEVFYFYFFLESDIRKIVVFEVQFVPEVIVIFKTLPNYRRVNRAESRRFKTDAAYNSRQAHYCS